MTFKIIVCVKQVPDTMDIKWTENNTIQRDGLDSIINPYDISALQFANNFKYVLDDVRIIAVSMGPFQAVDALKSSIAIGADEAYLLSDKKFAAADTLATAYTLSQFVKVFCPDFYLILCGQQAIDGDTAQTPSSLAEKLSIPQITNVVGLKEINEGDSVWVKECSNTRDDVKIKHPALVAVSNIDLEVIPCINGYISAQETVINTLSAADIDANPDKIGLKGSPTLVKKAYRPVIERHTRVEQADSIDGYANMIMNEVKMCR